MNASDQIKTEIKTEPMDEGNTTSENSATVKGEFLGLNMWYRASRLGSFDSTESMHLKGCC